LNPLPYLDIHTHRRDENPDAVSVASLSVEEILSGSSPKEYRTAGIHPWWHEDYSIEEISQLQKSIAHLIEKNLVWGVGETGIDRAYPEFLDRQLELFHWHLELSEKYQLPLIIHSVRAGSDFLQILKEKKPQMPWIFHDFRGNETLVKDFLRLHPKCFFSFGISIDNSPQIRELLPHVPIENLFLETDEQKHLDIHDIYLRASHHLHLDIEFLKSQIWLNFKKVAGTSMSKR
jgi:TatD DNase family protein